MIEQSPQLCPDQRTPLLCSKWTPDTHRHTEECASRQSATPYTQTHTYIHETGMHYVLCIHTGAPSRRALAIGKLVCLCLAVRHVQRATHTAVHKTTTYVCMLAMPQPLGRCRGVMPFCRTHGWRCSHPACQAGCRCWSHRACRQSAHRVCLAECGTLSNRLPMRLPSPRRGNPQGAGKSHGGEQHR